MTQTPNVVQVNDDILLDPFINLKNFQQNQPHLPENMPTTVITNTLQHEIVAQSTHNMGSNANLSASDVTSDSEKQSLVTGFHDISDTLAVNVVKVNTICIASIKILRNYHALQTVESNLEYPHYNYTCKNVQNLQQNDADFNQIIRYLDQSVPPYNLTHTRKLLLTVHLYVLKDALSLTT
jgi:hypothetical protein